jgi:hypothetical protein
MTRLLALLATEADVDGADAVTAYHTLFRLLAEEAEFHHGPLLGDAWRNHLLDRLLADDNTLARKAALVTDGQVSPALRAAAAHRKNAAFDQSPSARASPGERYAWPPGTDSQSSFHSARTPNIRSAESVMSTYPLEASGEVSLISQSAPVSGAAMRSPETNWDETSPGSINTPPVSFPLASTAFVPSPETAIPCAASA